jgi:hypothetical protein
VKENITYPLLPYSSCYSHGVSALSPRPVPYSVSFFPFSCVLRISWIVSFPMGDPALRCRDTKCIYRPTYLLMQRDVSLRIAVHSSILTF